MVMGKTSIRTESRCNQDPLTSSDSGIRNRESEIRNKVSRSGGQKLIPDP